MMLGRRQPSVQGERLAVSQDVNHARQQHPGDQTILPWKAHRDSDSSVAGRRATSVVRPSPVHERMLT